MPAITHSVTRAVIPVAGLGTRMGPIAAAVPKCMFPLADAAGLLRPLLHHVCLAAADAGVADAAVVVAPHQAEPIGRYLAAAAKHSPDELPIHVELIVQPQPRGFGDAVALAETFAAGEPVMVVLGDHVWLADEGAQPCAAQVAGAFARRGGSAMIGMQVVGPEALPRVGAARGRLVAENIYACEDIIEKPSADVARRRLVSPGLAPDRYLAHGGIYVFSPEIFDCLRELARADRPAGDELQLTAAQQLMLTRRPGECFLTTIAGRCLDCGSPDSYADAFEAVRRAPRRA